MIANYIPDFIVKRSDAEIWIIETKGREDLTDLAKWERLQQWCEDASAQDEGRSYHPLLVREDDWNAHRPKGFAELAAVFTTGGRRKTGPAMPARVWCSEGRENPG